jgi:DNA-binding NtrC family response regulator
VNAAFDAAPFSYRRAAGPEQTIAPGAVPLQDEAVRKLVGRSLAEVERWLIIGTLDRCLGNRTHAARTLGISIRTLRNKLNEYAQAGFPVPQAGAAR